MRAPQQHGTLLQWLAEGMRCLEQLREPGAAFDPSMFDSHNSLQGRQC